MTCANRNKIIDRTFRIFSATTSQWAVHLLVSSSNQECLTCWRWSRSATTGTEWNVFPARNKRLVLMWFAPIPPELKRIEAFINSTW